jgi:hypothetical protein
MNNQNISSTAKSVEENYHRGIEMTKILSLYGGTEKDWTDKIQGLSGSELNKLKRAIGDKESLLIRKRRIYLRLFLIKF